MREGGFSLRSSLLAWITIPLFVIIAADTFFLYRSALRQVNVAYDRTLLATAHAVGDSVRFERGDFAVSLPRALFEVYETDQSGRYFFRINTASGKLVAGDEELPPYQGSVPKKAFYPTIVQFYEDRLLDRPIRVAVLYQPVFSNGRIGHRRDPGRRTDAHPRGSGVRHPARHARPAGPAARRRRARRLCRRDARAAPALALEPGPRPPLDRRPGGAAAADRPCRTEDRDAGDQRPDRPRRPTSSVSRSASSPTLRTSCARRSPC